MTREYTTIGHAVIKGTIRDVHMIDKSQLKEEGVIRVMWINDDNKRVTSFVGRYDVSKLKGK